MSNIELVWDAAQSRGDWAVKGGRLATGNLLKPAVLLSLFTDRVAQADFKAEDGDRRGWWHDTLDGVPIGSRLWQLRRRKIANRRLLIAEATDILREALEWLIKAGIVSSVDVAVSAPPAGPKGSGTMLQFAITLHMPGGHAPIVRALWRSV